MSKLTSTLASLLCACIVSASVVAPIQPAAAQTAGVEQKQKQAYEQRTRQAHARAMRDKAYVDAIRRGDTEAVKAILIRNGAPKNLEVRIRRTGKAAKIRITIGFSCCPPKITVTIYF